MEPALTVLLTADGGTLEVDATGGVHVRNGNGRTFSWLPFHASSVAADIRQVAGRREYVAQYDPAAWNAAAPRPLLPEALRILVALEQSDRTRPLPDVIASAVVDHSMQAVEAAAAVRANRAALRDALRAAEREALEAYS